MDNRRKENREKLTAFTPVYFLNPKTLLGYLSDLTLHGGMVLGEKSVEVNKHGSLAIEFPDTLKDISTRIIIPARVAWCRPDVDSPNYMTIGFEFTELSPEHSKVITAILKKYRF
jgi:Tfp pilus assembly protein PilZ